MSEFGINATYYAVPIYDSRYIEKLKATGATWIRTSMRHGNVGDDSWNFLKLLKDNGFKILGIFANKIAAWVGSDWEQIRDLAHWRELVQRALTIYGEFLDAAEMWNEPDLPKFASGYMDGSPEHYLEMLQILHEELRAAGYTIPIVAGSVASILDTKNYPSDDYGGYLLARIIELGSDQYCDAYSMHIYNYFILRGGFQGADDYYLRGREICGSKPLWQTEMGNSDSISQSAAFLDTWFPQLINVNCPHIQWFHFFGDDNMSMLDSNFVERPSYTAFQSYATAEPPPEPPVQAGCMLQAATQGTMLAGGLPMVRAFRDRCLPRQIIRDYYALSRYVAPKIVKVRRFVGW